MILIYLVGYDNYVVCYCTYSLYRSPSFLPPLPRPFGTSLSNDFTDQCLARENLPEDQTRAPWLLGHRCVRQDSNLPTQLRPPRWLPTTPPTPPKESPFYWIDANARD